MRISFGRPWCVAGVVAALVLAQALPAAAQTPATVRVGNETKRATGTVVAMQAGDVACHLTLKDEQGATFKELADFEICAQKPSPVGKRVTLGYSTAKVMSDECQGDPNCKKTRTVTLVSSLRPADDKSEPKGTATPAPGPAAAAGHRCAANAVKQAEKLLRFHALPEQAREVSVGKSARMLGTLKSPAGKAIFDVLEVEGFIYKGNYRLRMIYGQIPGECILVGQELLEITNL